MRGILQAFRSSKDIESAALVDSLLKLLYGRGQREAQRLARDTLGEEEPGQISLIFMENGERHFETQEDPPL